MPTILHRMAEGEPDCAKIRLTFLSFFHLLSSLQTKNLLWHDCRSRFFYKLWPGLCRAFFPLLCVLCDETLAKLLVTLFLSHFNNLGVFYSYLPGRVASVTRRGAPGAKTSDWKERMKTYEKVDGLADGLDAIALSSRLFQ